MFDFGYSAYRYFVVFESDKDTPCINSFIYGDYVKAKNDFMYRVISAVSTKEGYKPVSFEEAVAELHGDVSRDLEHEAIPFTADLLANHVWDNDGRHVWIEAYFSAKTLPMQDYLFFQCTFGKKLSHNDFTINKTIGAARKNTVRNIYGIYSRSFTETLKGLGAKPAPIKRNRRYVYEGDRADDKATGLVHVIVPIRFIPSNDELCREKQKKSGVSYDRLLGILQTYVANDLEAADTAYVREILMDVCGCTKKEMEDLGFGYLTDTMEDDEE